MLSAAYKMLVGHKATCLGVIFGIFLATVLISQQTAIFLGLVSRSYRIVTDIPAPDIWIVDPATESVDKMRGIPESYLGAVRSIPGIEWAVPISRTYMPMTAGGGIFEICELYGIDDATLIGAPQVMIAGNVTDLRRPGGVIVSDYAAKHSLAKRLPDGTKVPLEVGDEMEINGHRAVVVGLCKITLGFYPQPIIFTTYNRMLYFFPHMVNHLGLIAAKAKPGENVDKLSRMIEAKTKLSAYSKSNFEWKITEFMLGTGILINFGFSVFLGIIIGVSIAGQIFYIMTLENMMYFALIKAIGGTNRQILRMILFQAFIVGSLGYALGIGATALFGIFTQNTTFAFWFPWQILLSTGVAVVLICLLTASISIYKVFRTDPKVLLGN